jgi:hypothetical protein
MRVPQPEPGRARPCDRKRRSRAAATEAGASRRITSCQRPQSGKGAIVKPCDPGSYMKPLPNQSGKAVLFGKEPAAMQCEREKRVPRENRRVSWESSNLLYSPCSLQGRQQNTVTVRKGRKGSKGKKPSGLVPLGLQPKNASAETQHSPKALHANRPGAEHSRPVFLLFFTGKPAWRPELPLFSVSGPHWIKLCTCLFCDCSWL